jgi:uncharacterized coiled-coil protein SlyX
MDDLTDKDRETLITLVEEAIRESRFPLSSRSQRLRAIRDKLRKLEMAQAEPPPQTSRPRRRR